MWKKNLCTENEFCNGIDYLKYDSGLIVTSIDYLKYDSGLIVTSTRTIDLIGNTLISPVIDLAKTDSKISYYVVRNLMGKNKDKMDNNIERVDNSIDGLYISLWIN